MRVDFLRHAAALLLWLAPTLLLASCSGAGPGGQVELQSGTWAVSGACFGHEMTVTLSVDSEGDTFTFADWSMAMGEEMPSGGTLSSADVTLTGDAWDDCTGTASGEGDSMSGSCESDGCAWGFELE
jgi:hypothetical protein